MVNQEDSYGYIKKLIDGNHTEEAIEVLNRIGDKGSLMQNARAVCAMREGKPEDAVDLLTSLVGLEETMARPELIDQMKLNLAEAQFLTGNISNAVNLIKQVDRESEHRQSLIKAFREWKRSLSLRSRIGVFFGLFPSDQPVPVNYPYGRV